MKQSVIGEPTALLKPVYMLLVGGLEECVGELEGGRASLSVKGSRDQRIDTRDSKLRNVVLVLIVVPKL